MLTWIIVKFVFGLIDFGKKNSWRHVWRFRGKRGGNHMMKTGFFGEKKLQWQSIAPVKFLKEINNAIDCTRWKSIAHPKKLIFFANSVAKYVLLIIDCHSPNGEKLCFCFVAMSDDFGRIFHSVSPNETLFEVL